MDKEIQDYLISAGFKYYAIGYAAKTYSKYHGLVYIEKESKIIEKNVGSVKEYDITSVEDIRNIIENIKDE